MTLAMTGASKSNSVHEVYINSSYQRNGSITSTQFSQILDQLSAALQALKEEASNYTDDKTGLVDVQQALRSNENLWAVYSAKLNTSGENTGGTTELTETKAAALTHISAAEKSYFDSIRPSQYNDGQYQSCLKDYDYRLSMLNPDNLPKSASGFEFVTLPEEGISRSTDMVKPPTFSETTGGVMRTDYTESGEVTTYIPITAWRKVSGTKDAEVGIVYSQQLPWGFRCYYDRGGGAPEHLGYEKGKYEEKLEQYLNLTQA